MPRIAPQVEIIAVQLMPDHIHFIVFVKAPLARPLGSLVRGFKAGAVKRWKNLARHGTTQVVQCLGIFAQVVLCLRIFAQVLDGPRAFRIPCFCTRGS